MIELLQMPLLELVCASVMTGTALAVRIAPFIIVMLLGVGFFYHLRVRKIDR